MTSNIFNGVKSFLMQEECIMFLSPLIHNAKITAYESFHFSLKEKNEKIRISFRFLCTIIVYLY